MFLPNLRRQQPGKIPGTDDKTFEFVKKYSKVHLLLHLQQRVHDFLCQRAVVVQIDNRLVSSCRKYFRLQLMMLLHD